MVRNILYLMMNEGPENLDGSSIVTPHHTGCFADVILVLFELNDYKLNCKLVTIAFE